VPKGVEHKTVAETHVLFIEKAGTINTGDQFNNNKTIHIEDKI